jgi:hypothetical protein
MVAATLAGCSVISPRSNSSAFNPGPDAAAERDLRLLLAYAREFAEPRPHCLAQRACRSPGSAPDPGQRAFPHVRPRPAEYPATSAAEPGFGAILRMADYSSDGADYGLSSAIRGMLTRGFFVRHWPGEIGKLDDAWAAPLARAAFAPLRSGAGPVLQGFAPQVTSISMVPFRPARHRLDQQQAGWREPRSRLRFYTRVRSGVR